MASGFSELVKKAKKGDSKAFAELYSAIYKELYYYALCNLNNQDDAADAVSDAVLDAFSGIKNLRDEDAFKGWMLRILTAKIKRKQAEYVRDREYLTSTIMTDDDGEDVIMDIPTRESKYEGIELLDHIESLSQNEKMCFSLNAIYGYTSDEISKLTGINAATVRTYLARGKTKLRKLIDDDMY
ncbi:MAG: sigma-70 family RNA polymerase sigma factor [Oscillospiraceae bacterium]|nr:sigma-70 family RNA polymerase sigma factor [Oscillospiraceae bacterium]